MRKNGRGFSYMLEKVLERDNKVRFVKLLQNHPNEITKSLLERTAEVGARKCLLALVDGEVCDPPPKLDAESVRALAYATHGCPEPRVIELMLKKCNAIPLVNVSCTIGLIDGLPIHFCLVRLSYLDHLYPWARGDSLVKLVYLLCMWQTKSILDCVRLLAEYTDSINNIAWTFVKYGALKQFTALLLVAREKVMAPFDDGLTILEYLTSELNSASEYESASEEEVEYKNMLMDAQSLLNVFDKAGDSLSLYCSSMQKFVSVEDVITDVCMLLRKAKATIDTCDFNLSMHFGTRRSLAKLNYYKLASTFSDYLDESHVKFSPAGKSTLQYSMGFYPAIKPIWEPKRVPSLYVQQLMMSTIAGHVRITRKPLLEHAHVNPILKPLAYTAVKLKNGLRLL